MSNRMQKIPSFPRSETIKVFAAFAPFCSPAGISTENRGNEFTTTIGALKTTVAKIVGFATAIKTDVSLLIPWNDAYNIDYYKNTANILSWPKL